MFTSESVFADITMVPFVLDPAQIRHENGSAYIFQFRSQAGKVFTRIAESKSATITENGVPLPLTDAIHDEIRNIGLGRNSVWYGSIYFSSSDNTDPRTNGREYAVMVPGYVQFIEKLPESGIKKFAV